MSSLSVTEPPPAGPQARPDFERIALLLQGGGTLGSYQGGVYQALADSDLDPDSVAGNSIGAINSAPIAGNAPERRVERLRSFWETVTQPPLGVPYLASLEIKSDLTRQMLNQWRAFCGARTANCRTT
jgi:NTE family protein